MGLGGLMVAAGGALGAAGRYGISLLPWRGELPLLTLCTNFLGALAIGFVVGLAGQRRLSPGWTLFWKTGVCGGFTTFSTFALETEQLLQAGRGGAAALYAALSVGLCVLAVFAGQGLVRPYSG